jgi:hypothetical protein
VRCRDDLLVRGHQRDGCAGGLQQPGGGRRQLVQPALPGGARDQALDDRDPLRHVEHGQVGAGGWQCVRHAGHPHPPQVTPEP